MGLRVICIRWSAKNVALHLITRGFTLRGKAMGTLGRTVSFYHTLDTSLQIWPGTIGPPGLELTDGADVRRMADV